MKTLAILDPSLKSYTGHFLTYDNAVADGFLKLGYQTSVFGAKAAAINLPVRGEFVPTFRYGLETAFLQGPLFRRLSVSTTINEFLVEKNFREDLEAANIFDRLGHNGVVLMHTTTHQQIRPLADWVTKYRSFAPTVVVMLRYAPSPNPYAPGEGASSGYRAAFAHVVDRGVEANFRFVTDSDILVDEYRALTHLPISLLPIPHTSQPQNQSSGTRTITYLGNARSTKGFQYLPAMVDAISSELADGSWKCELQANVFSRQEPEMLTSVELLRQTKATLLEEELTTEAYENLLGRSSLVVIPYQLLYYYAQTSGVLCEAMAAGKVTVVPRGTWGARQVAKTGGGVTFLPGDRISFVEAVRYAMQNIETLTAKASSSAPAWRDHHNPDNFAKSMAGLL